MQRLITAFFVLAALLLQSCIEGEEEVWIEKNGSGKLVAHYSFPSLALSKLGDTEDYVRAIKLLDEREVGIEVQKISFEIVRSKAVFHLEAKFDDILDLLELAERNEEVFLGEAGADSDQLDAIAGEIDFGLSGLHPRFRRAVSLGPVFPTMVRKQPGMLGPSNFKYILHLPFKVEETNAHELSPDKKTVTWKFKLKEHLEDAMIMSVQTEIPVPWWGWLILSLLLLALLFALAVFFRIRARRKKACADLEI